MAFLKQRRKHSIIDGLPEPIKAAVDQMFQANFTFAEIADFINTQGYRISIASVHRYSKTLLATVQSLRMANESMRVIMEELAKYPMLDTTEGIIRLLSHQVFEAIQKTPEEKWGDINPVDLIGKATALVRAAGYKQRVDLQNQSVLDAGYDKVKYLVFEAMANEDPELYKAVSRFLAQKKSEPL
jgi:hypothetical protein